MPTKKKTKKKSQKLTFKEIINSTSFLSIVFILLLGLVIILGIACYNKSQEVKKRAFANIIIPIIKKDNVEEFSINAKTLSSAKKYTFKITNYLGDQINTEEIDYRIIIDNPTNAKITLRKADSKEDLINDQKQTIIEELSLSTEEQEDIYYYVEIKSFGSLKSDDLINIKIES